MDSNQYPNKSQMNTHCQTPPPTVPPMPTEVPLPSNPVSTQTSAQISGSGTPTNHKKRTAYIILAVIAAAILAIAGGFGYHFYITNSHAHAVSEYSKAVNHLAEAKRNLDASLKQADAHTATIQEGQIEKASLLSGYKSTTGKMRKLSKSTPPKGISDTSSATTDQLKRTANDMNAMAVKYTNAATTVTHAAQQVIDSKNDADKVLKPVENAVSAAEKQKKANNAETEKNGLNLKAIAGGDYSSLNGTWTNPDGAWMKISNGMLTPQNPVSGTTPPYRLREPDRNNNLFAPSHLAQIPKTQHTLYQDGARVDHPQEAPDIYFLVAVQRGVKLYNASPSFSPESYIGDDPTDSSRDRIIPANATFSQGQIPFCQSASCAYYRDGGNVSAASQQKLKDKVDHANKLVGSLNQGWEQEAKTNFQCRIDVVNGKQQSCESDASPSSSTKATKTKTGMDIDKIVQGDCSSIAGNWVNSRGHVISFQNSCPSGSFFANTHMARWTPPRLYDGYAEQYDTGGGTAGDYTMRIFVPAGTSMPQHDATGYYDAIPDDTDTNKDRILILGGAPGSGIDPADNVYYRQ